MSPHFHPEPPLAQLEADIPFSWEDKEEWEWLSRGKGLRNRGSKNKYEEQPNYKAWSRTSHYGWSLYGHYGQTMVILPKTEELCLNSNRIMAAKRTEIFLQVLGMACC